MGYINVKINTKFSWPSVIILIKYILYTICTINFRGGVWTLKFKNDGNVLISGSSDKSIKLWDTNSGKLIETFNGHENAVTITINYLYLSYTVCALILTEIN